MEMFILTAIWKWIIYFSFIARSSHRKTSQAFSCKTLFLKMYKQSSFTSFNASGIQKSIFPQDKYSIVP